jgi:ubiquinone/menaquinone biosynthesis C-methylase UbiE
MSSGEYFDSVAREWDTMQRSFFSEKVREKAFAVANIEEGRLAADIGAGTGFITEGLIKKGVRVIAVDQSKNMIEELREKVSKATKIDFRVGSAEQLPIADETVDYVFANMLLHHVGSPPDAISEMTRILKPGGKIIITDLDEHSFGFLKTEHKDRWMGFKREEVRKWLLAAGFKNVSVDCVGENCCATSNSGCDKATVSIFVAFGQKS